MQWVVEDRKRLPSPGGTWGMTNLAGSLRAREGLMSCQNLATDGIRVTYSIHRWLPQTENWIWNQTRFLAPDIHIQVVCESTENLDAFSMPSVSSFDEAPRIARFWDNSLRKLRLRRHRGFLVSKAREHGARVLHSHFGNTGWADIGAARRTRAKHVVTFYGFDVNYLPKANPIWYRRYHELFSCCDRVICEGHHMAKQLADLGCSESKLVVHPLGIALDAIAFKPRSWLPGQPLRVLLAASFQEKKGIPCAIAVLGKLQHHVPLQITIIGDANYEARSQREKGIILASISQNGLKAKVRMLGYQPHAVLLQEAYDHHIFLSPSSTAKDGDNEGGAPVSVIEMAASGMPVITTQHCDIPQVFPPEQRHRLAGENDVEGLLEAFKTWLDNSSRWSADLRICRRHIEMNHDAKKLGPALSEIYRRLA
jgi:colanic acid/amylovoran biosynthesis glycosyltransferase